MEIVLGLDLDGVLYDFHSALYTYCQYEMNYAGSYDEFWMDYIQNLSKSRQDYLMSLPIPYESTLPTKSTKDFLDFAKERAQIYYITSRPKEVEVVTERFLRKNDFPFLDNLIFAEDKSLPCRLYSITHFLDDGPRHLEATYQITNAYLMAKIWNREFRDKFKTVYSLKEFGKEVFGEQYG